MPCVLDRGSPDVLEGPSPKGTLAEIQGLVLYFCHTQPDGQLEADPLHYMKHVPLHVPGYQDETWLCG